MPTLSTRHHGHRMLGHNTWFFILIAALTELSSANAQTSVKTSTHIQSACITPAELSTQRLYGLWEAVFTDLPTPTGLRQADTTMVQFRGILLFERHPEHANSVRGTLSAKDPKGDGQAMPPMAQLSGDVEEGEMILDESDNGQRISAVWVGTASAEGCGLEIRGTRRLAGEESANLFVMRKAAGWR